MKYNHKKCRKQCFWSSVCKNEKISIDNKVFCYKQLHQKCITEKQLFDMAKHHRIILLDTNGRIKANLTDALNANNKIVIENFSNYFFDFVFYDDNNS